jgi:hypothetical protein
VLLLPSTTYSTNCAGTEIVIAYHSEPVSYLPLADEAGGIYVQYVCGRDGVRNRSHPHPPSLSRGAGRAARSNVETGFAEVIPSRYN